MSTKLEQLRKSRTTDVKVDALDGMQVTICKLTVGGRKRLQTECLDADGDVDLEQAARMSVKLCVVDPQLEDEDLDELPLDAFLELASHIAAHSGLDDIAAGSEEGSAAHKGFPAPTDGA